MSYEYLDKQTDIDQFCLEIQSEPYIAVDTEFIREKTYYPQLCLIQIASAKRLVIIDPFAVESFDSIKSVLHNSGITKVFHASSQDVEMFYHLFDDTPKTLFDTQIAATLLGLGNQISYAELVRKLLGVTVEKGQARTDWAQRPLSSRQLEYAANDVRYLFDLYPLVIEKLTSLGRIDWLKYDFEQLSNPNQYRVQQETLWRKIKGHQKLRGVQLALLRTYAIWRESTAQTLNKPKRFVLKDQVLIDMAVSKPKTQRDLESIRQFPKNFSQHRINQLLELTKDTLALPKDEWPKLPDYQRLTKEEESIADCLMAITRWCAVKAQISTEAIGTRKDIERLVTGHKDVNVMKGWRYDYVGKRLEAFMEGQCVLQVANGRFAIQDEVPVE
jgi:ribonuclease D